ncbi:MAG: hypothetical protein H6819_00010 [Phycisphaerales bacterium]|nr:hypothetical protein [Phycisphaerales bacterium]MCB9857410.1 hypothetical protein [Phycisphaerales bacterium]
MGFGHKTTMKLSALALCVGVAASMGQSCGNVSPFLAAMFNNTLTGVVTTNPPPIINDPNENGNTNADILASVCDLPDAQRVIQIGIQNEAAQAVDFSITLVVSAGVGGFVCDNQIQEYLNAGYRDAIVPGSGGNAVVGCDTISQLGGTRILTLEFGVNQGIAARLTANPNPDTLFPDAGLPSVTLRRADNNSTMIPLPEVIVVGSGDPDFVCTGNSLCTQRGFVYVSAGGFPVGKAAEASRIQGTVCAENFGTAPEMRLDKTLDQSSQPYQFGRGGTIIFGVLDRAGDALDVSRNQVAWLVIDENDSTLHTPER